MESNELLKAEVRQVFVKGCIYYLVMLKEGVGKSYKGP